MIIKKEILIVSDLHNDENRYKIPEILNNVTMWCTFTLHIGVLLDCTWQSWRSFTKSNSNNRLYLANRIF